MNFREAVEIVESLGRTVTALILAVAAYKATTQKKKPTTRKGNRSRK